MEELLKQLMTDIHGFRDEVTERFDRVEKGQEETNVRLTNVEKAQKETNTRLTYVEKGLAETNSRLGETNMRLGHVERGLAETNTRLDESNVRLTSLEKGQVDIAEALKHNTTLMIENFTAIRKDIRMINEETKSDVDLLFKEVEQVKRRTHKIEQKLKI